MNGKIEGGNYFNKPTAIGGGTEIAGGNFRLANLLDPLEAFAIVISGGAVHGVKYNGVQIDPANPPAKVVINLPHERFGYPYTWQRLGPMAVPKRIKKLAKGRGPDVLKAWHLALNVILSGSDSMSWQEFLSGYSASIGDNTTYSTGLFNLIKTELPVGWGWSEVRDWVQAHSFDQLIASHTEVVEELI